MLCGFRAFILSVPSTMFCFTCPWIFAFRSFMVYTWYPVNRTYFTWIHRPFDLAISIFYFVFSATCQLCWHGRLLVVIRRFCDLLLGPCQWAMTQGWRWLSPRSSTDAEGVKVPQLLWDQWAKVLQRLGFCHPPEGQWDSEYWDCATKKPEFNWKQQNHCPPAVSLCLLWLWHKELCVCGFYSASCPIWAIIKVPTVMESFSSYCTLKIQMLELEAINCPAALTRS